MLSKINQFNYKASYNIIVYYSTVGYSKKTSNVKLIIILKEHLSMKEMQGGLHLSGLPGSACYEGVPCPTRYTSSSGFTDFSSFSPSWTVTHQWNSLFPIHASLNHPRAPDWPAVGFLRFIICILVHPSAQTIGLSRECLRFMVCRGDSLCNPTTLTKREELCSAHAWQSALKPKDGWES